MLLIVTCGGQEWWNHRFILQRWFFVTKIKVSLLLEHFISTERWFLKHFGRCNRSLVLKSQQDLYFFPENQRFKTIMIDYAHHFLLSGSMCGRHHWWGGSLKTVEGSAGGLASVLLATLLLSRAGLVAIRSWASFRQPPDCILWEVVIFPGVSAAWIRLKHFTSMCVVLSGIGILPQCGSASGYRHPKT